ncbi:YciI family protein [Patulibacter sp. NPDC049589]|uniref:YciI family protein n=1 Tax=Patulibacter sp. NPDC049589 TaxID=3154731 RepID=UPI00341590A0
MRFMLFMYPGDYAAGETGTPTAEAVAAMSRFNEELTRAGVLLALDGLHPPTEGARVRYAGGSPTVVDGPFAEAKEVLGGYWVIDVRSKEEAVAWATKIPAAESDVVEVRRVYEMSDFPADVQEAAGELSRVPAEQTQAR